MESSRELAMQILQALNAYGAIKDRVDPPMITAKDWENMCCNVIEGCILDHERKRDAES